MNKRLIIVVIMLSLFAFSLVLALPISNDSHMIPVADNSPTPQAAVFTDVDPAADGGSDAFSDPGSIPDSAVAVMMLLATAMIGVAGISRKKD